MDSTTAASAIDIMAWLDALRAFAAANWIVYFLGVFVALMAIEALVARHRGGHGTYEAADTRANVLSGAGAFAIGAATNAKIAAVLCILHELTPLRLPADHWATWALAVVVLDFCLYWAHRLSHETRLGWAIHVTHHSSQRYNLSVALRQSWTLNLLAFFFIPLPLLGVPIEVVLVTKALSSAYQFWLHTEQIGRLPAWFEFVFNTPSHHRVHHGSNPRYLDKNYGGTFILWDRAFGTFEPEVEPPVYGLTHNITSHDVLHVNFHEWRALLADVLRAHSWRERLAYLVHKPGWQPAPDPAQVAAGEAGESRVERLYACASTLVQKILVDESCAAMPLESRG